MALAEAGVPMLYVQNAMASSARMANVPRAACERHGTLFNTGVLRRFDNRYHAVREPIAARAIGSPLAAIHFDATNLMHGLAHSIDTLSYLLRDPPIEAVRGELIPHELRISGDQLLRDPDATFRLRFCRPPAAPDVEREAVRAAGAGQRGGLLPGGSGRRP